MQDRRSDEDGGADTAPGWSVALPDTCGTGARGTHHPTQDRRPDEAGLSARFDHCGGPGAEPAALGGRRLTARQKPTRPEGVPTGEQRRNHDHRSSHARRRWRCAPAARRRPQRRRRLDARQGRRRRLRTKRPPPKKKAAGRKKAAAKKAAPQEEGWREEEGRCQEGRCARRQRPQEGRRTQEGRCCRGSVQPNSMP